MKLTAQVKLVVTPAQADALKQTMQAANAVCDSLSAWAWQNQTFQQYPLHKGQYAQQRAASGLTAQVVVRAIGKVADAYKLDEKSFKRTQRTFQPTGAVAYDDRILTWYVNKGQVSIWSVDGRLKLPFECGEYQCGLLAFQQGEADLALVDGQFYLMATVSIPDPPLIVTEGVLGVDLGIVQIATDSEGHQYSGDAVKACRRRSRAHRSGLQRVATKNSKRAKRTLKKMRRKASRFYWAFDQLKQFVVHKARRASVPVIFVDPRNTSRTCSVCGYCDKANRKSQSQFLCLECGFQANANMNASVNIARKGLEARATVRMPKVATA